MPEEPQLNERARTLTFGEYVVGVAANGRVFGVAFGDGTIRIIDSLTPDAEPVSTKAHNGAALCIAADIEAGAFLTGGDDGKLVHTSVLGETSVLAEHKHRWIEHVTSHAGSAFRVYAVGKDAIVLSKKAGGQTRTFSHKSSVAGLAINPKGRRLAVSHYDGVSLWWLASKDSRPTLLEWKGSHLQLAWSPDGMHIMSAMQENALHGWRLSDAEHMRMSGYPAKIRALAFTRKGQFLATGGAESVVCWPFTGGGPMGKTPAQFGHSGGTPVTALAANPKLDIIAAGFENGAVVLGQPGEERTVTMVPGGTGPVTALCWNPEGEILLAGTETGEVHIADFRS